eukprot:145043-Pelagomonas_calceolata.AAC.4
MKCAVFVHQWVPSQMSEMQAACSQMQQSGIVNSSGHAGIILRVMQFKQDSVLQEKAFIVS